MEPAVPFDWHRIFIGDEPVLYYAEIVFRVLVIYLYAVLLMRLMGKRGSRNLSPLENMVIIALGSATGDAMFYPQVPITYALMIITLIVLLSRLMANMQVWSTRFDTFIDGLPLRVIEGGRVKADALRMARMREDELLAMLRSQNVRDTGEIDVAWLERSGQLGYYKRDGQDVGDLPAGKTTMPERVLTDAQGQQSAM